MIKAGPLCVSAIAILSSGWLSASFIDAAMAFSDRLGSVYARNRSLPLRHEMSVTTVKPKDDSVLIGLQNVIYSIGLEKTEENQKLVAEEWKQMKRKIASKEMAPFRKRATNLQIKKMFGAVGDEAEYEKEKLELEKGMGEIVGPDYLYIHSEIYSKVDAFVIKAMQQTKMKWDYKPNASIDMVYHDLSSGKVKNAVFIFHGDQTGQIYDVNLNTFDPNFFNKLNPSLLSLSFFSCHGDEVVGHYHLNRSDSISYYSNRLVYTIPWSKKNNPEDQTENRGFPKFLSTIDNQLYEVEQQSIFGAVDEYDPPVQCAIKIEGFKTDGDIYTFRLNRVFVGATKREDDTFPFDCELLALRKESTLIASITQKDGIFFGKVNVADQTLKISVYKGDQLLKAAQAPNNYGRILEPTLYLNSKILIKI